MIDKNAIPKHWEIKKLAEVCVIILGQSPPSNTYNSIRDGLPFFQGKADFTDLYPIVRIYCNSPKKIAEPNDILLSVRAPVGTTNIANHKCCIGRGLAAIRYKNFKFLFYFLKSIENKLDEKGTGTTFRAISGEIVRNITIPLPPLSEQQQIVSKIEEFFSDLDKGKHQIETVRQQLKTYRQAVLKWAFEGRFTNKNIKDGQLPEGWKYVKVADIGKIETGTTPSKKISTYYSNDFPFYKPTDLEAGYNVRSSLDNLSKKGIKEARFLPENSILVTCIGATIGKSGIIRKAGASNQQINAIIPFEEFNPNFVYYQAIAPLFQKSIKENASSTTLPILNKTKFMNLVMVHCPIEEQQIIVQQIETRLSVCDKMEETIENSLQQVESLRQSILKQAFEGKLIKPDPK